MVAQVALVTLFADVSLRAVALELGEARVAELLSHPLNNIFI